jgi:exopolysaccharide production protein ExoZ
LIRIHGRGIEGRTTAKSHSSDLSNRGNGGQALGAFEIKGSGRSLPIEGLHGVALALVFLHHYCTQFITYARVSGFTEQFARAFQNFGAYGVELFFVLSGFLIYGILLLRRPSFIPFLVRRAQRLYPAFMVAFVIGILWEFFRPEPKIRRIPDDINDAVLYLIANILFIPGLFPIAPLFIVNWSMSYEWWVLRDSNVLFSFCGISALPTCWRITIIIAVSAILLALSASGLPHMPVRGLSLFGGYAPC